MCRKAEKHMEPLNNHQMTIDLQLFLSKDRNFLDNPKIPTDPYILSLIALGLQRRYYEQYDSRDIERAATLLEMAAKKTTVASIEWVDRVYRLCKVYYLCYATTSNIQHIQRIIQLSEQIVEHTALDSPHLEFYLHDLASYLLTRGKLTRNTRDIKRASRAWRECIKHTTRISQYRYVYMSCLFYSLSAYNYFEDDMMDLEDTFDLLKVFLGPIEASKCSTITGLLEHYMLKHYFQSLQLSGTDVIIECWEQSLSSALSQSAYSLDFNRPLSIPCQAHFLDKKNALSFLAHLLNPQNVESFLAHLLNPQNTGISQKSLSKQENTINGRQKSLSKQENTNGRQKSLSRQDHTDDLQKSLSGQDHTDDLQKSISRQEKALSLSAPGTLRYVQNLYDLGLALQLLYKQTNDLADLNRSIDLFELAIAALSSSSPMQPIYRANLTAALQKRYKRTTTIADLKRLNQLKWQL
jgi:hypothetical protein